MLHSSDYSKDRHSETESRSQTHFNHHQGIPGGSRCSTTTTTDTYAHDLYRGLVEDSDIEMFLQQSDAYDSGQTRWSIPSVLKTREELIGAMYGAIQSIVGRFIRSFEPGVERELRNTQDVPACQGSNNDGYRVCPVLVVRAAGPSFEIPKSLVSASHVSTRLGFSNMATYFSVKMESEIGSTKEIVEEMSSYARRILHAQPNRFHVRSLILTERHAWLAHFDRGGSQITPPFDIHQHPATLIRLVAGLSSTNETMLGLDDSIQWTIVDGRKAEGTLTTTGPSGEPKTYPIVEQIATNRDSIRGRATTCWRVRDPETLEDFVVKDSWRPDDRSPEYDLFELTKDIPGVAQMISHETGRVETRDIRCPSTVGQYLNRVSSRITLRLYGKPLTSFTSTLQLLRAMRDALAAHQKLVGGNVRILHRDISHNNVLFGQEGAAEGERGVLIDLDVAFRATEDKPTVRVDHNLGTRVFQSMIVIENAYLQQRSPAYDYLDDLESFLYLLAYIFLLYKPDGSRFPSKDGGPSIVWGWGDDDPELAYANKRQLFGVGPVADTALDLVEEHWGAACESLFKRFSWWVLRIQGSKSNLLYGRKATGLPNALEPLLSQRDEHYADVLRFFDEAIVAVEAESLAKTDVVMGDSLQPTSSPPAPAVDLTTTQGAHPRPSPVSLGPPPAATQLRRSARIHKLRLTKGEEASPESSAPTPSALPTTAPSLRRSARIRKRQLEDDQEPDVYPKAKRVKKSLRVNARSR